MKSQTNPNITESNYTFHTTVKSHQINGEQMLEIDVPGDGSCLFYAVTLSFLLPALNNKTLFLQRFNILFGENNNPPEIDPEKLYDALLKYKGDPDFIKRVPGLEKLIDTNLRKRVTDDNYQKSFEELEATAISNGITLEQYIDGMTNGMGKERTKKWANQIEMVAMARMCNLEIELRRKYGTRLESNPDKNSGVAIKDSPSKIYLIYCNLKDKKAANGDGQFNHYRFLIDPKFFAITQEQIQTNDASKNDKPIKDATNQQTQNPEKVQQPTFFTPQSISQPVIHKQDSEKTTIITIKNPIVTIKNSEPIQSDVQADKIIAQLSKATNDYFEALIKHQDPKKNKSTSIQTDLLSQKIKLIKEFNVLLQQSAGIPKAIIIEQFKTKLIDKNNLALLTARRYQIRGLAHATKTFLKLVFLALPALLIDAVTLGHAGAYSSLFSVKGRDFVKDTKKISKNYYSKP